MRFLTSALVLLLLYSCQKSPDAIPANPPVTGNFIKYSIKAGAHYTGQNNFTPVETEELTFTARFDSSAIYESTTAENQYDINKLYGFSDNGTGHHQYSARFGWRWSDGALRIFAYVYNGGKVMSEELGTAAIGAALHCSIKVSGAHYLFQYNETVTKLPRQSATAKGKGYLLYPYFGGDETAPHDISIWIKNR